MGVSGGVNPYSVMSNEKEPLDPDLAHRFDQELAELSTKWISLLPEDFRVPMLDGLRDDPYLTHQVFSLVVEGLMPEQALQFLQGAARDLARERPEARRPLLAGLLELSGLSPS